MQNVRKSSILALIVTPEDGRTGDCTVSISIEGTSFIILIMQKSDFVMEPLLTFMDMLYLKLHENNFNSILVHEVIYNSIICN